MKKVFNVIVATVVTIGLSLFGAFSVLADDISFKIDDVD